MKVLFVISSSETAFWLSEVTHPYWHLTERGVEVDFASPAGGKVVFDPYSDPYFEKSTEPEDLVSKGFLSDKKLKAKLDTTLKLSDVELGQYDAIHVAGGRGATFDLFPNADVAKALEYFWSQDKVVGAICHGVLVLARTWDAATGRSVLADRPTTCLPKYMERSAYLATAWRLGRYYRTYPTYVEDEVVAALGDPAGFERGPRTTRRGTGSDDSPAFVVEDGNYLSARWPGDAYLFAKRFERMLSAQS